MRASDVVNEGLQNYNLAVTRYMKFGIWHETIGVVVFYGNVKGCQNDLIHHMFLTFRMLSFMSINTDVTDECSRFAMASTYVVYIKKRTCLPF